MHPRELIRRRVYQRLVGVTLAGDEVYDSRPGNVFPEVTPAVHIVTPRCQVELYRQASGRWVRATCAVDLYLFAEDRKVGSPAVLVPASKTIDDLVEQIEAILDADRLLRDPISGVPAASEDLQNGIEISIETDFDQGHRRVQGGARLSWQFIYVRECRSQALPPEQDLELVHVEYETGGNNTTPEAVDEIVPEG